MKTEKLFLTPLTNNEDNDNTSKKKIKMTEKVKIASFFPIFPFYKLKIKLWIAIVFSTIDSKDNIKGKYRMQLKRLIKKILHTNTGKVKKNEIKPI